VALSLPPDGSDGILMAANSAYTAAVRKIVIGTWPALARCLGIQSPETARRFVATTGLGAPALAALARAGCRATNLPGVAASIRDDMAAHSFPQLVLARRFLWKNPEGIATAIATTGLWTTEDLRSVPEGPSTPPPKRGTFRPKVGRKGNLELAFPRCPFWD
jgi:hypothetical protein